MKSVRVNELKTAKLNLGKTVLWATAILIGMTGSTMAQQSLRDLAEENGCNWLAGQWVATTDEGTEIQLVYRWELDGHLVTVDFKMGEYASRGMIFYVPGEEKATAVSVDNRGGRSKGTWEVQDGKLISKSEHVNAEGEVRKYAAVYSKVDTKTIRIALYGLDQDDELTDEPSFTMDYKRKASKKTDKPTG
ncbi:MAG: hypothetical protein ACYSWW_13015 [Planctomycetota bacterium]|jgi:hypothetical protein